MLIRLKLLGEHMHTAMSFHRFGNICFMLGEIEKAMSSFRKALELRLNFLADHLDTAMSYQLLGEVQLQNGDFSDALEFLHTALRMKLKD